VLYLGVQFSADQHDADREPRPQHEADDGAAVRLSGLDRVGPTWSDSIGFAWKSPYGNPESTQE
jgi:hypothetical protein